MSILDGIGDYISSVTYTPPQTKITAEEVKNDAVVTGISSVQTSNFDTVEISAAGRAYQSQSDSQDQSREGAAGAKGKKAPAAPPENLGTRQETSEIPEEAMAEAMAQEKATEPGLTDELRVALQQIS